MKLRYLAIALLFAAPAWADSITDISGSMKAKGQFLTYTFNVQQFVEPTFIADVLNGQVVLKYGAIGCHPCTSTYINDIAEFLPGESVILAEFGFNGITWDLVGTASGVALVDPPSSSAVPEPGMLTLLLAGIGALKVAKRYGGEQLL